MYNELNAYQLDSIKLSLISERNKNIVQPLSDANN